MNTQKVRNIAVGETREMRQFTMRSALVWILWKMLPPPP
jgi:hypothetical protein